MKAHIISLGCPKSLTDSEVIMGRLASGGNEITLNPAEAEIIIVNTCAFLKASRDESLEVLKEVGKWKKKGKCKRIYIAGCLPKYLQEPKEKIDLPPHDGFIESVMLYDCKIPRIKATNPWTAYVKISEGCDNRCTYCLIPDIRGAYQCRKTADVISEVKDLAKRGVKEIIFVAQDTGAHPDFAALLSKAAHITGIQWIRVVYAHPKHLTGGIIDVMAKEKNILKYIDLPLQHSSDKILKAMNRKYTSAEYIQLVEKLRVKMPGIAIRTTLIIGFPGETQEDFDGLCDFITKIKFTKLGAFAYSREEGTPAASLPGQIAAKVAASRVETIMNLQAGISKDLNTALIGSSIDVIVDGPAKHGYCGRAWFDAPEIDGRVEIRASKQLPMGSIVTAKVIAAKKYDLVVRI